MFKGLLFVETNYYVIKVNLIAKKFNKNIHNSY
jgi:hypothetical protein